MRCINVACRGGGSETVVVDTGVWYALFDSRDNANAVTVARPFPKPRAARGRIATMQCHFESGRWPSRTGK